MSEPTIDLGTREDGSRYTLPISAFDYHAQFIAPTRRGKTRTMALATQQLILKRPDAAFVVIDPKGDLYDLMKGWAYEQHLGDRLLLLDVSQRDAILGFNPLKPHWSLAPEDQANLQYDILAHALGIVEQQTALLTHEREKWMRNALFALIHARLTYCEAAQLLDPANGSFREAVIRQLPPSDALGEFRRLQEQTANAQRNPSALRTVQDQLGHSVNQFRRLTASPVLRRMYASDRTIDFRRLFDDRRILLVRLAPEDNAIDPQHQQLLGMQIVNEVIREVFGRSPTDRVQTYCLIDEAGRFATKDVTEVLDQGGSYRLSLFLAHQHCSQLTRPETHDRRFLDSVLTNTHLKFVGGGLAPRDAQEMGDTINRHLLDPDKPHIATATKRQLQKVVEVASTTRGLQVGHAHTDGGQWADALGTVETEGSNSNRGRHSMAGRNAGDAAGVSITVDPVTQLPTVTTSDVRTGGSNDSTGDDESAGTNRASAIINTHTDGGFAADTDTVARSEATTTGPAVHPTEVFEEYQPEALDTQQHRFTSKMIRLPDRHQMCAVRKEPPVAFRVADVPDTFFVPVQIEYLDRQLVRRNPEYSSPAEIEAMTASRQDRIFALPPASVAALPPASLVELLPDPDDDSSGRQVFRDEPKAKKPRKKPPPPAD